MFLNLQRKKEEEKIKVSQFEFLCEETFFSDIQHFSEVPHYSRSIKKSTARWWHSQTDWSRGGATGAPTE